MVAAAEAAARSWPARAGRHRVGRPGGIRCRPGDAGRRRAPGWWSPSRTGFVRAGPGCSSPSAPGLAVPGQGSRPSPISGSPGPTSPRASRTDAGPTGPGRPGVAGTVRDIVAAPPGPVTGSAVAPPVPVRPASVTGRAVTPPAPGPAGIGHRPGGSRLTSARRPPGPPGRTPAPRRHKRVPAGGRGGSVDLTDRDVGPDRGCPLLLGGGQGSGRRCQSARVTAAPIDPQDGQSGGGADLAAGVEQA